MRFSATVGLFAIALATLALPVEAQPRHSAADTAHHASGYGSNPGASGTFLHDGVTFYYEVYGKGEPVVLIHGNGGSIAD